MTVNITGMGVFFFFEWHCRVMKHDQLQIVVPVTDDGPYGGKNALYVLNGD